MGSNCVLDNRKLFPSPLMEKERETETHRHTDRDTETQTNTDRHRDRDTDRHRETENKSSLEPCGARTELGHREEGMGQKEG